jgi:hypothetical protein
MTRTYIPLLVLFTLLVAGCKHSPERTAYVTFGSITASANAAIGSYRDYIKLNPQPPERLEEVRQAVASYEAAVATARSAITAYKIGQGTADHVDLTLDVLSASAASLTTLIATFTH